MDPPNLLYYPGKKIYLLSPKHFFPTAKIISPLSLQASLVIIHLAAIGDLDQAKIK